MRAGDRGDEQWRPGCRFRGWGGARGRGRYVEGSARMGRTLSAPEFQVCCYLQHFLHLTSSKDGEVRGGTERVGWGKKQTQRRREGRTLSERDGE